VAEKMIYIKAIVKGEPDASSLLRSYEYIDNADELIFIDSVNRIRDKLANKLKINVDQSLMLYCYYAVSQLRANKPITAIEDEARRVLSPEDVMIGVPETIRDIALEVSIDHLSKQVLTFHQPLLIPELAMR